MSVTVLRMVVGSIPCSMLYAVWISRRRWVTDTASRMESVMVSA